MDCLSPLFLCYLVSHWFHCMPFSNQATHHWRYRILWNLHPGLNISLRCRCESLSWQVARLMLTSRSRQDLMYPHMWFEFEGELRIRIPVQHVLWRILHFSWHAISTKFPNDIGFAYKDRFELHVHTLHRSNSTWQQVIFAEQGIVVLREHKKKTEIKSLARKFTSESERSLCLAADPEYLDSFCFLWWLILLQDGRTPRSWERWRGSTLLMFAVSVQLIFNQHFMWYSLIEATAVADVRWFLSQVTCCARISRYCCQLSIHRICWRMRKPARSLRYVRLY